MSANPAPTPPAKHAYFFGKIIAASSTNPSPR